MRDSESVRSTTDYEGYEGTITDSLDARFHVTALRALTIVQNNHNIGMRLSSTASLLLIYLLTTNQLHDREALAELFWPERQAKQAASNLRTLLTELRRECAQQLVITRRTIAVDSAQITYDVATFNAHITAAQASTPTAAVPHWEAAVSLHQRPFLSGVREPRSPDLQLWLTLQRELLYHQMLNALRQLVAYHTAQGNRTSALSFAQRWLTLEPLEVEALRAVLHLSAEQGEQAIALTYYQAFRQAHQREYGTLPENAELEGLVKTIVTGSYPLKPQPMVVDRVELQSPLRVERHITQPRIYYLSSSPLGTIYGRTTQIERIVEKLCTATERLISLIGMGGAGKTVLAQTIGHRLQQEFAAGVCFVSLTDLPALGDLAATQQQVALAIATALGVTVRDDNKITAALLAHLQPLTLLLILDNCEQLVGIAPFFGQLLQTAPQLRLLVTSRVRLNLTNERVEMVTTLPLPPTPPSLSTMADTPSVQLFLARAEQQLATFALDAENMAAVHRICHAVGGLPLALEMAAHWITLYTPQEIAETIDQDTNFLTRQTSDGPHRQRSIAEVFDYSWQLLTTTEQHVLTSLCIFQHSFDRRAALTVAACTAREISTLIHGAMLEVKSPGVYALHPLIKSFAAAHGSATGEVTTRYIAYFFEELPLSDGTAPTTPPNQSATERATHYAADLAHAWELAVAQRDDVRLLEVLPRFSYFWWVIGRPRTGIRLLRSLQQHLARETAPTPAQQRLLGCTLHQTMRLAHILLADPTTALADGERALRLLMQCGTSLERGHILLDLGNLYVTQERAPEAEALLQQALAIAEQEQSLGLQLGTTVVLSRIEWARGHWEAAAAYCQHAFVAVSASGEAPPETTDLYWEMFNQALLRHDLQTAEQIYQQTCAWGNRYTTDSNQRLQQREMAFSLALVQERWADAHALAQTHLATMTTDDAPQAYYFALIALAITTLHVDTAANALKIAEEALALATAKSHTADGAQAHLVIGVIRATLGQISDARHHFSTVLEHALACQGELYALRNLFGSLFQLAKITRAKLPPALFAQVVATVATQPQCATQTRIQAFRLAEREGIDLTRAKEQARQAVDWGALEALARQVQRHLDGT